MGFSDPVIEALVLPSSTAWHDLPLGRGVALQLVGTKQRGVDPAFLEELGANDAL